MRAIIGKTIKQVTPMRKPNYDDEGWLRFEFTDGTSCIIEARYGSYTGESVDEYPTAIIITDDKGDLIPC